MLCFYLLINDELTESRYFYVSDKLVISHNMANILLVSYILLLFHSPKGSWNKSAKYEKLGKYWPYCTRNRAITNAYSKLLNITFCTSFWKRVHNSKKIAQGLFVLTVGYVDMTTYPLTKYYYVIEGVYFIYTLFKSFISTLPFLLFLYTALWRYKRYYLHASIDVCFILCSILLTQWRNRKD